MAQFSLMVERIPVQTRTISFMRISGSVTSDDGSQVVDLSGENALEIALPIGLTEAQEHELLQQFGFANVIAQMKTGIP